MGVTEFQQWAYYFTHENEVYRDANSELLSLIRFEIASLRSQLAKSPFSGVKVKDPLIADYLPTKIYKEVRLPEHELIRNKYGEDSKEFKSYRNKYLFELNNRWRAGIGMKLIPSFEAYKELMGIKEDGDGHGNQNSSLQASSGPVQS